MLICREISASLPLGLLRRLFRGLEHIIEAPPRGRENQPRRRPWGVAPNPTLAAGGSPGMGENQPIPGELSVSPPVGIKGLSRHILSRCAPCGIPRPLDPAFRGWGFSRLVCQSGVLRELRLGLIPQPEGRGQQASRQAVGCPSGFSLWAGGKARQATERLLSLARNPVLLSLLSPRRGLPRLCRDNYSVIV